MPYDCRQQQHASECTFQISAEVCFISGFALSKFLKSLTSPQLNMDNAASESDSDNDLPEFGAESECSDAETMVYSHDVFSHGIFLLTCARLCCFGFVLQEQFFLFAEKENHRTIQERCCKTSEMKEKCFGSSCSEPVIHHNRVGVGRSHAQTYNWLRHNHHDHHHHH